MNHAKITLYGAVAVVALWVGVLFYFFFRDVKPSPGTDSDADTLTNYIKNIGQDQEIQILKDSIQNLTHEKIILQEKLSLSANDNYELRARIWAINEYIRTGRFPADSTVCRKFPRNHGQPDKVRIRQNTTSDVLQHEYRMPEGTKEQREPTTLPSRAIERLPKPWRSVSKTGSTLGNAFCEGIKGAMDIQSSACNGCLFCPSFGCSSTLILIS